MLDKILLLAKKSRETNNFQLTNILVKIAVDITINQQKSQLKFAKNKAEQISSKLKQLYLYQHAAQIDRLAQDLENKIGEFEVEDPIEAVLKSYSLIHKIAEVNEHDSAVEDILTYVEVATDVGELTDQQIFDQVKKRSLGLSQQDKEYLYYMLEKEFNLTINNTQKVAQAIEVVEDEQQLPQDKNLDLSQKVKQVKKQTKQQQEQDKKHHKWYSTFPTTPPIWGGFAYQAIVPYQQSSQINFWSLASSDQEQLLNKLGLNKK